MLSLNCGCWSTMRRAWTPNLRCLVVLCDILVSQKWEGALVSIPRPSSCCRQQAAGGAAAGAGAGVQEGHEAGELGSASFAPAACLLRRCTSLLHPQTGANGSYKAGRLAFTACHLDAMPAGGRAAAPEAEPGGGLRAQHLLQRAHEGHGAGGGGPAGKAVRHRSRRRHTQRPWSCLYTV